MTESIQTGLIIKAQSGFFTVETGQGFTVCQLRGKLKQGKATGDIDRRIKASDICLLFRRFVRYRDDITRSYVDALEARPASRAYHLNHRSNTQWSRRPGQTATGSSRPSGKAAWERCTVPAIPSWNATSR